MIKLADKLVCDTCQENIDGRRVGAEKCRQDVSKTCTVSSSQRLELFVRISSNVEILSSQRDDQVAKLLHVCLLLRMKRCFLGLISLHHVKHSASTKSDAILVSEKHFAGAYHSCRKPTRVYGFECRCYLTEVAPELTFSNRPGCRAIPLESGRICKMLFSQCSRCRMVVSYKHQGTVAKGASCEAVMHRDHVAIVDSLPILDCSNGLLCCQSEAFKPPQNIEQAILTRLCLVDPAVIAKDACAFLVVCV